jgi:diguanylate cyclase (GGDEF)-like protein
MLLTLVGLRRTNLQRKAIAVQLESIQRLNESSNELHSSLDLREVLDAVESVCRGLFHADTYFLGMLDERSGRVEYARAVEQDRVLVLETADLSQGLTGHVMRTGQAIFPDDIIREEPWRSMVRKVGDTSRPIRSLMMGPLIHKSRVIGVLSVQSLQPKAYRPFQKQLFLQVCQQVVTAVAGARLYRRATEDFLTRLFNKSFFEERLGILLQEGKPFGLIFMDCDNFKEINDTLGHVVGDQYLEALGKRLMGLCRSSDVPCRYGGDEFAILLPGANADQMRMIAARVQDSVRRLEYPVRDQVARTTVSIGTLWSGGNRSSLPVEDLLRKVDAALYKAKTRRDSIEETAL